MKAGRTTLAALGLALASGCGAAPEPASAPEVQAAEAPASEVVRNRPPVFDSVRIAPEGFAPGEVVSAVVDASDPDGDQLALSHRWELDGERYGGDAPTLKVPESAAHARISVTVVAVDGRGGRSQYRADAEAGNRPPVMGEVAIEPGYEIRAGEEPAATFRGSDPDGDAVHFLHTWRVNDRAVDADETRLAASHFERGDVITLEVRASDGELEGEPVTTRPIRVLNTPPVITSTPAGFDASGAFNYRVEVSDPDGDRLLRFRLVKGPAGMTIDWLKGHVRWTPEAQQTGRHQVEIEVDDQHGGVVTQSFAVEVGPEAKSTPAAPAS